MHKPFAAAGFLFLAAFLSFGFTACSDPYPAYGVIVWSADEAKIPTGTRVALLAHSELRKTVQTMRLDEKLQATGDPVSVEQWRVREFPNYREMKEWAERNKDSLDLFARSLKLALPVRSDPSIRDGNINYRLRDGEDVKVLAKAEKESDQGGLKGYWYEILTRTGTHGWVFSSQIQTWRLGAAVGDAAQQTDPQLERLCSGNWRPEEFPAMISTGDYDLGFFKPGTALVIDQARKSVHLATDKDVLDFTYSAVTKLARNIWSLAGTSIQLTFRDENTLVVQYQRANNVLTRVYVNIQDNIGELYEAESKRRAGLLARMAGGTGTITSGNYGSISIKPDGSFTWTGIGALQPRIKPAKAQESGNITFDLFLDSALRDAYRGVASFNFAGSDGIEQVNFLYQFRPDGLQLEFVPRSLIKGREVKKADSNPTVLFFGY
jgi:hypothetical protein